ncbi:hypothetical protein PVAND_015138 [Polypedilum vanderplanki]|uniref:Uncharacterized protein n=1 Tax=Polypedilum vanderplanki TaxID=319348 RepID=A0A9J6BBR3_POLVA|nr:hypothetical protein PVAND_015138 [Polypedilum vanderplanki]
MLELKKFLFFFKLDIGGLIIGGSDLILSSAGFLFLIYILTQCIENKCNEETFLVILIATCVFVFIINFLLIQGIEMSKANKILPAIFYRFFVTFILIPVIYFYFDVYTDSSLHIILPSALTACVLNFYCFLVLYSLYFEMKHDLDRKILLNGVFV